MFALVVAGCASSPGVGSVDDTGEASSFVSVKRVSVRGVTYRVWLKPGSDNFFIAETAGGVTGSRNGASTAVIRGFNCTRANMRATDSHWRRSEGRGAFCDTYKKDQRLR